MKAIVVLILLAMTSSAAVTTPPKYKSITWEKFNKTGPQLKQLGHLAVRHARDIASSPWSVGCETLDRDYGDFSQYKDYVGELGVKHARIQSGWAKTEKQKGIYDFAWLDTIVSGLKGQGVQPWVCLCYGNPLYKSEIDLGAGIFTAEETMTGWRNYVEATVTHYKDSVTRWEIWNEPSHSADPAAYANLMIQASKAIRKVQPKATIMGFTVHGSFSGGEFKFPRAVFEVLKEKGELECIDIVTYHPYTSNPDSFYAKFDEFQNLLKAYNPRLKLYQGESGCPSILEWGHALNNYPWTEYSQAKWNMRRMAGDWARNIETSIFTIVDLNYGFMLQSFGLLRADLNHKIIYKRPSFYGVQHMAAFFDSTVQPTGILAYESDAKRKMEVAGFRKGDTPVVMAWFNDQIPDDTLTFDSITLTIKGVVFKDPVYVEMITGRVYNLEKDVWKVTEGNTSFAGLPMWDSPIMLAERAQVLLRESEKHEKEIK
jgi:uncharacterized protein YceK